MKIDNKTLVIILVVALVLLLFGGFGFGTRGFWGGYSGFGGLLVILSIIAAIWVIYDVVVNNKGLSDGMKLLWIVLAILFSIITAIIYYLVGRNQKNDLFRRR